MKTHQSVWWFTLVAGAALGLVAAACMHPLASAPDVRTPYPTVRALLELANVTSKDVVYAQSNVRSTGIGGSSLMVEVLATASIRGC